jgi:cell wall-associated NlpC family hydrolase
VIACALASACASTGGVARPRPFPGAALPPDATAPPTATSEEPTPAATPEGAAASAPVLIATALGYQGVPYRNGGSDPSGFDCSGFVQWVFAQHGMALPREVRDQFGVGIPIDRDDVRAGDLVFFETVTRGASHVGIALDNETFIHAPSSRGVVRIERYTSDYWKKRYLGARRVQQSALTRTTETRSHGEIN